MMRRARFSAWGHRFEIVNRGLSFSLLCDGETVDDAEGLSTCELSYETDGHTVRVDVVMGVMALANVFLDGEFFRSFRFSTRSVAGRRAAYGFILARTLRRHGADAAGRGPAGEGVAVHRAAVH